MIRLNVILEITFVMLETKLTIANYCQTEDASIILKIVIIYGEVDIIRFHVLRFDSAHTLCK